MLEILGPKAVLAKLSEAGGENIVEEHFVEEMQPTLLVQGPVDGTILLYEPWAPEGTEMRDLEQVQMAYNEAILKVVLMGGGAPIKLTAFQFRHPRAAGTTIFIGMLSVHDQLNIDAYKHAPSQWTHRCHQKWNEALAPTCTDGFVVHSRHLNHAVAFFNNLPAWTHT